ncbi:hypothetical protein [Gulosibacter massiliensis]|uniref:hypothetical protein n=1 Tax=Gulosibacter massiliensis TaxID=2479839 RepID=UPI000F62CF4D|nr:hypothetical protein [Gulosibacter massiliensis]
MPAGMRSSPPVRIVPEPHDTTQKRLWRHDPSALDPAFPFVRVRAGMRWGRMILPVLFGVPALVLGVGFVISIIGGGSREDVGALPIGITMAIFGLLIALGGISAARNWQWRDRHTGLPVERIALREAGDVPRAIGLMQEIHRQSTLGPSAWRPLTDGRRWRAWRRAAADEAGTITITIYGAPGASPHTPPAYVTARVRPVLESVGTRKAYLLPAQWVHPSWAAVAIAAAMGSGAAGTDGGGGSTTAQDDWKCDDGSADGGECSDSSDGGDSGGDGGGGDGGGGD